LDNLDIDIIEAGLKTSIAGRKILLYSNTASTNDIAWEYASEPDNNGLAVFAEQQYAGRGRRGNKWFSETNKALLCSILLTETGLAAELLTLACAVAVAEAIISTSGADAKIKWPNDIIISGQKVAGILVESRGNSSSQNNFVIGIGINCHQSPCFFQQQKLSMPATSIDDQTGNKIDRNLLATELLGSFDKWLATIAEDNEPLIERWKSLSFLLGHRITLHCDQQQFSGNCIGIDPLSGLILQLDAGSVRMFPAAHTSIIGLS
jgi:BirA family biotin operon repressor/biotin-[acetyl-CoA-carboxylase] ligase